MDQSRLLALSLLTTESDMLRSVSLNNTISYFVITKIRKVKLWSTAVLIKHANWQLSDVNIVITVWPTTPSIWSPARIRPWTFSLNQVVTNHTLSHHLYADDVQVHVSLSQMHNTFFRF